MSADNGIYVLSTNDGEIRVAHAQAIENIGEGKSELNKITLVLYFKDSEVYTDAEEAWLIAVKLLKEFEYVEYGICPITLDIPFPNMTFQRAISALEDYYEAVELEKNLNRVFQPFSVSRVR